MLRKRHDVAWAIANTTIKKIAVGGIARLGQRKRIEFAGQVFARAWPFRIHGFGVASWDLVRAFPWHSLDASSWCYAPMAMGRYAGYTGRQMHLRGARGIKDMWIEVAEHHKRADYAQGRWRNQLLEIA